MSGTITIAPNATHAAAANPSLIYMHHQYQGARHNADREWGPSRPRAASAWSAKPCAW